MCGIAGSIEWRDSGGVAGFNLSAMSNRGPDAQVEVDSHADDIRCAADFRFRLGHARLSIVDLSTTANQPMSTEDGPLLDCFQWRDLQPRGIAHKS